MYEILQDMMIENREKDAVIKNYKEALETILKYSECRASRIWAEKALKGV